MSEAIHAPWSPSQLRAIQAWQQAGTVHPLTCQTSEHGALMVAADQLRCATCGYEQTWVPSMCAETYPGDYAPPLKSKTTDFTDHTDPPAPAREGNLTLQQAVRLQKALRAQYEAWARDAASLKKTLKTLEARRAALAIAVRLMHLHLEMVTPGGVGRDSAAWDMAQDRVRVLTDLLDELEALKAAVFAPKVN